VRFDGWRGSVAPLKPFCYPILHAQKPMEGSYLDNMRAHGVGAMAIDAARVPFGENEDIDFEKMQRQQTTPSVYVGGASPGDLVQKHKQGGRTPANLLSYGDLLGDLQRYADLDAWCDALGLPEAAAELLSAGLVYVPKSSRAEKNRGLPDDYDAKRNPCAKPVALCAYLITLATREGQTVLDPFCGEAPVGVAATLLKRNFVGIELEPDFCQTARARITHAQATTETVEAVSMRQLEF
jgi:hypothetical protein